MICFNPENKRNVAKAISLIFDCNNGLSDPLQCVLGDRLLWAATEYDDNGAWNKYFGPDYWSFGAINKVLENITARRSGAKIKIEQDLRHEHAVPKKVLNAELDRMHAGKELSEGNILKLLENHAFAVILSKNEDLRLNKAGLRSKMPKDIAVKFDIQIDIFSRYKEVGLEVYRINRHLLDFLKKGMVPEGGIKVLTEKRIC